MSDVSAPAAPSAPASTSSSAPASNFSGGSESSKSPPGVARSEAAAAKPAPGTTAPPNAAPTTPAAAVAQAQKAEAQRIKLKMKVDGAMSEREFSEEELTVKLQKGEAAEKRFAEAAKMRKQFEDFQQQFANDPFKAAELIGMKPEQMRELAEKHLAESYMAEQLKQTNPMEYELKQAQKQLEQYQRQAEEAKQQQMQKAQQEHSSKIEQQLTQTFIETLETAGLPKNRQMVGMMAQVMQQAVENGIDLTPQQLAAEVNERVRAQSAHVFKELKGDRLLDFLGKDTVDEVLRHSLRKVRPPQAQAPASPQPTETKQRGFEDLERTKAERRSESMKTWRQFIREKA